MRFHSGQYDIQVPFVIYANVEAILLSSEEEVTNSDPLSSHMKNINRHVLSRFCTFNIFAYGEVEDPLRLFRGKDFTEVFCSHIKEEVKILYNMFPQKPIRPLTPE